MSCRFHIIVVVYCLLQTSFAKAQEPTPVIKITEPQIEQSTRDETTTSSIITIADDYKDQIKGISEILSNQPGVHITRYGGLENATSISIRGSSPEEVQIYLDGIPLNSAVSGAADLSPFLIDSMESIEIYRGSTPTQFGNLPSAGSIQFNSKKITGNNLSAFGEYGSFNTWRGNTQWSLKKKNWGLLLSMSVAGTSGNFSFLDDNGTPVNTADDARVERKNNDSVTIYPFVKFQYQLDDRTSFQWINHFIDKTSGVPGFSSNQSNTASVSQKEWLSSFQFKRSGIFHPTLNLANNTSLRISKNQYSDQSGEIGLGGAQDNDDDELLFSNHLGITWNASQYQTFSTFLEYQFENFRPEDFLRTPSQGGVSLRHTYSVGISDEINLFKSKLLLSPSLSLINVKNDINNDDPSYLTPATFADSSSYHKPVAKFGVKYFITHALTLQSSIARGVRFPTFVELFGDKGGVVGNQLLNPQSSINFDVGAQMKFHAGHPTTRSVDPFFLILKTTYFQRWVDDFIQFQQSAGFARAENVGKANIKGIEVEAEATFLKYFKLNANYTFSLAKDGATNRGKTLPGNPKHELDVGFKAKYKKFELFSDVNWMDDIFLDPLNTRKVNDRMIFGTGVSVAVTKKITLTVEAKNLANSQIVDVVGFPLPGRSFFGRISWVL